MSRGGSAAAVAVALLACASASTAQDRPHLSTDPQVRDARALVESGRYEDALALLRPLGRDRPDRVDVLFLTGLAAVEASGRAAAREARTALLEEAVAALRAILIDRPGLARVRLELARAFFLLGEDDLARAHFERVLASGPAPAVTANVRRFLETMRARRRLRGRIGAALAPDGNLNTASGAGTLHFLGLPFRIDDPPAAQSGTGVLVWGGGEYQHPAGPSLRLRAGADLARREYAGSRFDQTVLSAHVGPRWLIDAATEASLLAVARRRWRAGRPWSLATGVRLELERRLDRRTTAWARASWRKRAFQRARRRFDGPVLDLSAGAAWLAAPTLRVELAAGHAHERPGPAIWRNGALWARAGMSAALASGFTVGGTVERRWTRYRGSWWPYTPAGTARKDRSWVVSVSALNRGLTLSGFSPQVVLAHEARRTNAQIFHYDRSRAELRFIRQF